MPSIITANRLNDGIVVYLAKDGSWQTDLAQARIAVTDEGIAVLEADAADASARQLIVGAYTMTVTLDHGRPTPGSVRETIRASHRPTIRAVTEPELA